MSELLQHLRTMADTRRALQALDPRLPDPTKHGYAYVCFEDLVAQRGREYTPAALTRDEWKVLTDAAKVALKALHHRDFPIKACWANSQMLVLCDRTRQLRYAEGYVFGDVIIPVLHGWVVLNGKLIDVTLRARQDEELRTRPYPRKKWPDRAIGTWRAPREYVGIEFEPTQLDEHLGRHTLAGYSMIDDWTNDFPLLRAA